MLTARRAENCSAIGGPVGRFRLAEGKVWLDGLYRCRGDIPLEEIYPEFDKPALATWLNGVFYAKNDSMCFVAGFGYVYRSTFRFVIENGVVTSLQRQENDEEMCNDPVTVPVDITKPRFDQWRSVK